jgi:hypothetical protein
MPCCWLKTDQPSPIRNQGITPIQLSPESTEQEENEDIPNVTPSSIAIAHLSTTVITDGENIEVPNKDLNEDFDDEAFLCMMKPKSKNEIE